MKILITGITGLLGAALYDNLSKNNEVFGVVSGSKAGLSHVYKVDITKPDEIYGTISKINPDIVIHSAAMSNVDECEKFPDKAYAVNAVGARNVAAACQRFDTVMAYISTDYVFGSDTILKQGFSEFDQINPSSVYARSKAAGEVFVKELLNRFFIVRTSWLFGPKRDNFISSIYNNLAASKKTRAVFDMISSPTYVLDISETIAELVATNCFGTYHISNAGFASRYDVGIFISKLLGSCSVNVEKISLKELKLEAKRPYFSGLKNYMLELNGFKPLRSWQEAVTEFLSKKQG